MKPDRETRLNVFATIVHFLDTHYDCDCPQIDPEGSNTAEALHLTEQVFAALDKENR